MNTIPVNPTNAMSFDELVAYLWGKVVIGIGAGNAKDEFSSAMNTVLLWKEHKANSHINK